MKKPSLREEKRGGKGGERLKRKAIRCKTRLGYQGPFGREREKERERERGRGGGGWSWCVGSGLRTTRQGKHSVTRPTTWL